MYSILYVDDEEVLLGLNKIYLERTGDFSVETAKSAQDGLIRIQARNYDAIVSDYDMPHMDGIAFLKEVRSRFGSLPFLLFTGKGREEIVIQAVDNGVDYYIQKGHDMHGMIAELSHKIKRAVERRRISDELERSRQQMNDIINFLPDATFVRDINGRVIAWNHAIESLTGIRKEEMLGKGDYEYALPFYHKKCPLLADLVLEKDPVIDPRYLFFERTGDKMTSEAFIPHLKESGGANLWVAASPLYDAHGKVTGAIESFRDISDHYAIKRDLRRSREMN
jgi:PAS domain S-box-containing protein